MKAAKLQEYETEINSVLKAFYILSQNGGLQYLVAVVGHKPRKPCRSFGIVLLDEMSNV